jgi:hypothetical protein
MRKVLLIDTSLLCVWLKVPGKETAGNNNWNFELVEQKIQTEINQGTILVLPLATVIETGNHIATHSDALVSALSEYPESVLVCERDEKGSHLRRLEPDKLKNWLENYTLGDLWRMGQIGGNRW